MSDQPYTEDIETDDQDISEEHRAALERIEALETDLMEKNLEYNHYMLRATELEAELEKSKARIEREAKKSSEQEKRALLTGFLEVMDNFDRALESEAFVSGTRDPEAAAVIEGIKLVRQSFLSKLGEFGVTRIESRGTTFDPNVHDAVSTIAAASPSQAGKVVGVVREGYLIGGETLRPATVAVAKG